MNLYLKKCYYTLFVIFLFVGCRDNSEVTYKYPEFKTEVKGEFKIVVDSLLTGAVFGIEELNEDQLIIIAAIDNKFVHIFDKISCKKIGSYVSAGRSDKELLFVDSYSLNREKSEISLYSERTRQVVTVDLSDNRRGSITSNELKDLIPQHTSSLLMFNDEGSENRAIFFSNIYGAEKLKDVNRLTLLTRDNKYISHNESPIEDVQHLMKAYSQISLKISPDNKKFAIATIYGAILETYSIGNENIKNINTSYLIENSVDTDFKDIKWGFSDISVDDNYIYGGFCGTTDISLFNKFVIFDWKGKPVKYVNFDEISIVKLSVMQNGDIYAIVSNKNRELKIAKLFIE